MKEKEYIYNITLKFTQIVPASNKKEAWEILENTFFDEFGIELDKTEVELVEVQND